MSLIDGNGLSAADVAAVTGNNGGFGSFVGIWSGCCESVSIRNTSAIPILVENANVIFSR